MRAFSPSLSRFSQVGLSLQIAPLSFSTAFDGADQSPEGVTGMTDVPARAECAPLEIGSRWKISGTRPVVAGAFSRASRQRAVSTVLEPSTVYCPVLAWSSSRWHLKSTVSAFSRPGPKIPVAHFEWFGLGLMSAPGHHNDIFSYRPLFRVTSQSSFLQEFFFTGVLFYRSSFLQEFFFTGVLFCEGVLFCLNPPKLGNKIREIFYGLDFLCRKNKLRKQIS
jgi:hypothetical protein